MTILEVHKRINDLLAERNWSLYKLAEICELPHTSLYTMIERQTMPKLDTLAAICKGFGITLSDFFMPLCSTGKDCHLREKERLLLEFTHSLSDEQLELVLTYAKGVYDASR